MLLWEGGSLVAGRGRMLLSRGGSMMLLALLVLLVLVRRRMLLVIRHENPLKIPSNG